MYFFISCSSKNIILLGGIVYEYEVGSGCGLLKTMQKIHEIIVLGVFICHLFEHSMKVVK